MNSKLKLLLLEDEIPDAELIQRFLSHSGLAFTAVIASDKSEFEAAIRKNAFDAILADNSLPQFNSIDALRLMRERNIDIPFILVTGTVSEEFAVDIIHKGADDYILKNNLTRLPASIKSAIEKRKTIREKRIAEDELKELNRELRDLSSHLQNIREEERIQIARDIHDELGQQLTGLKMDVHSLAKRMQREDDALRDKFTGILVLIEEIMKSVRRISTDLRPSVLDDLGLAAALQWQSREVEARFGIKVIFISSLFEMDLPAGIVTGLFRIYQEALTNAVRHANAHIINSSLSISGNRIILEIKDDGKGIPPDTGLRKNSFGLLGIKERVFVMNGTFELKSKPGKGTALHVSVPL